jgi:hypothetical protein
MLGRLAWCRTIRRAMEQNWGRILYRQVRKSSCQSTLGRVYQARSLSDRSGGIPLTPIKFLCLTRFSAWIVSHLVFRIIPARNQGCASNSGYYTIKLSKAYPPNLPSFKIGSGLTFAPISCRILPVVANRGMWYQEAGNSTTPQSRACSKSSAMPRHSTANARDIPELSPRRNQ